MYHFGAILKRAGSLSPYLILVAFTLLLLIARFSNFISQYFAHDKVDPSTLHIHGEFVESNLGAHRNANGSVTVHLIAERYLFVPASVTVPVGSVHLRITSADTPHGFILAGKRVRVVPGAVTDVLLRFTSPGKYEFHCDEFCGPGHHAMMGNFVAVFPNPSSQADSAPASGAPANSVAQIER